eukprot:TRINITY_DN2888_c0_g1_i1.p1 TRINITY_DN2888_c0_g1~~TRINITY_DN2888_c0_g1_i1.p1  ORF type:complete len:309 (+),score=26.58 TRINITY_DN2888_c0_g1_i1:64-990(+)
MYVGAWQEYKLAKVIQLYKSEQKRRPGSRGSQGSILSVATARHPPPSPRGSTLASSSRSVLTDVEVWQRKKLQKPRPGARKKTAGGAPAKGTIESRRKHINSMLSLYTNKPSETTSVLENPPCPHCPAPDTRYCSGTGRLHEEPQNTVVKNLADEPIVHKKESPVKGHQQETVLNTNTIAVLMKARDRDKIPFEQVENNTKQQRVQVPIRLDPNLVVPGPVEGNILSPVGAVPRPTTPPPMKNQPSHRNHIDEDDAILRFSHTMATQVREINSPPSSSLMPPEAEVAALLQWTDQLDAENPWQAPSTP